MRHYRSLDQVHLENAWVTIGNFDGVHRGHQTLIRSMAEAAHAAGDPAVVITFHPHPAVVLGRRSGAFYLTTPEERAALIAGLGVDGVITLEFNHQLAELSARDFMIRLTHQLKLRQLWFGPGFALGHNREGNETALRALGRELGYEVRVFHPLTVGGQVVSSSVIRRLVQQGDVSSAARLLGRWYSLEGLVVRGDGRGKGLGFPTANLDTPAERLLPAAGIYACWSWLEGVRWPSVANVGVRPTFENTPVPPRAEAFVIGLERDIYGQMLRVEFVRFLRPEERFPSAEELIAQMAVDVDQVKKVLKDGENPPDLSAQP